ncbi:alpha/beta fold hydrolase [Actinophytocola oryzae]|uniref:Pimeloyl-ACP methyl ester carboxylesterase n=1 Tax=Actinophytocola oryzae TaxID=502181 RepID=A0A4R7VWW1_9PSEU|nr:alpha/beta hydrolase [Actinophytocola oryzae]TDV54138.1 pimeloyl-ACP methyl ester carboxylesterase [Actinophytocola oryzae]
MVTFSAHDGTLLTYHRVGETPPLVCVPGGPMRSSSYLGDLGGLPSLALLDLRGTGGSAEPTDPATYRCDHLVDDVEALRAGLGLERIDLLGHSAGAAVVVLYAARYPDRVGRLVLVTPSPRVVGVDITDADRRELAELRRDEPWFPEAFAAFERIWAGDPTDADWAGIAPFFHGRWDDETQATEAAGATETNETAALGYYSEGALDPDATRAALVGLTAPVLLLAGEYDVALPPGRAAEYAGLFPNAELVVQPASGHYPYLDDRVSFATTVGDFLG